MHKITSSFHFSFTKPLAFSFLWTFALFKSTMFGLAINKIKKEHTSQKYICLMPTYLKYQYSSFWNNFCKILFHRSIYRFNYTQFTCLLWKMNELKWIHQNDSFYRLEIWYLLNLFPIEQIIWVNIIFYIFNKSFCIWYILTRMV